MSNYYIFLSDMDYYYPISIRYFIGITMITQKKA